MREHIVQMKLCCHSFLSVVVCCMHRAQLCGACTPYQPRDLCACESGRQVRSQLLPALHLWSTCGRALLGCTTRCSRSPKQCDQRGPPLATESFHLLHLLAPSNTCRDSCAYHRRYGWNERRH